MILRPPIISEPDAGRIRELCARLEFMREDDPALAELLAKVSEEAEIVPADRMPPDVVAVGSEVSFRDPVAEATHRVSLVYPEHTSPPDRRISVLSPVGRAILGRFVGDVASFVVPDGSRREIRILALHGHNALAR